ncbi:MAG TPA: diguanylate cyclase [Planctomycetota bacterium]|nr:diguanylate cyclase [Planctomycetota bacterium]
MTRTTFNELKNSGALPSPTGVGLAILRLTQREDFVLGHVARTIQSDPALTGRILKLANASLSASEREITSVEEAVMKLSVGSVRSLALGFTLVSANRVGEGAGFDYDGYWSRSLINAVAARFLATERGDVPPATAFTCALLAGIGRLALASAHPEEYAKVIEASRELSSSGMLAVERRELGLDHAELAAAMLKDWRLPEAMVHAVFACERERGLVTPPSEAASAMEQVLRGAARLGEMFQTTGGFRTAATATTPSDTTFMSRELALSPVAVVRLRNRIVAEWQDWSRVLQVPFSSPTPEALADTAIHRLNKEALRRGLSILAVDDDPVTLRLLSHHLALDGHRVALAKHGAEALALALKTQPQMIVTDLSMPEMDGLELCRALRASNVCGNAYVLVVTGHDEESRIVEAFEAGADEYVNKPFNANILLARVRAGQRMVELRERVESDKQELNRQNAQMQILNRKLSTAAMTDVLTELPNRRHAMRRLDEELSKSRTEQTPLSVILLDIDHFKDVNDRHGHDIGDIVLREVARTLRGCTRRNEEVCRLGGEEFLVIVPQTTRDASAHFAERLREAVQDLTIRAGDYAGRVTVSLGVSGLEDGAVDVDELIKIADTRAYLAKASGRNCVVSSGGEWEARSA